MSPIGEVYKAALPSGLKAEEGYRPKTETYIGLSEKYRNERAWHIALDMLGRADKQRMALMDFLSLTGWGNIDKVGDTPPVVEVTRDELMNESHCTYSNVKSLIDKGILYTYKREVGRLAQGGEVHLENIKKLNAAQQDAYNQVLFLWVMLFRWLQMVISSLADRRILSESCRAVVDSISVVFKPLVLMA